MSHDHCQAPGLSDYEPMDPLTNLERVADYVGNPGCCALEHSDVQVFQHHVAVRKGYV